MKFSVRGSKFRHGSDLVPRTQNVHAVDLPERYLQVICNLLGVAYGIFCGGRPGGNSQAAAFAILLLTLLVLIRSAPSFLALFTRELTEKARISSAGKDSNTSLIFSGVFYVRIKPSLVMFGSDDHRHAVVNRRGELVRRCCQNGERGNSVFPSLVPNVPKTTKEERFFISHPSAIRDFPLKVALHLWKQWIKQRRSRRSFRNIDFSCPVSHMALIGLTPDFRSFVQNETRPSDGASS